MSKSKIKAKFTLNPKSNEARELSAASHLNSFLGYAWEFKATFVLVGLLLALLANVRYVETSNSDFLREAVRTQAKVTSCEDRGGKSKEGKWTLVGFRYEVDGSVYDGQARLSDDWHCGTYAVGGWFPAYYRPADPSNIRFDGWIEQPWGAGRVYLAVLLCALIYAFIDNSRRTITRRSGYQERLREQGVLLDGEIVEVDGGKHSDMVTVQYRFTTPKQTSLVGWTSAYRPDLKGKLPLIGIPILVLYMSDSDHQAL